jgi:hypothetical protein
MPILTASTPMTDSDGTLFTGVLAFSIAGVMSNGGVLYGISCQGAGSGCLLVDVVDGVITGANKQIGAGYGGLSPVTLPVTLAANTWRVGILCGDPAILKCDLVDVCSKTPAVEWVVTTTADIAQLPNADPYGTLLDNLRAELAALQASTDRANSVATALDGVVFDAMCPTTVAVVQVTSPYGKTALTGEGACKCPGSDSGPINSTVGATLENVILD